MRQFLFPERKHHYSISVSDVGDWDNELYKLSVISITTDDRGNVLKVSPTTNKFRDKESLFEELEKLTKTEKNHSWAFRNQQRMYREYLEWQYKKNN